MPRVQLEVCVETVADAVAAAAGGADRLELCASLKVGGLTPSLGTYSRVRRAVRLPVVPGRYPDVAAVVPKSRPTVGGIDEGDARDLLSRLNTLPV